LSSRTDAGRRSPDQPLYTLRNRATGETIRTIDPGRALGNFPKTGQREACKGHTSRRSVRPASRPAASRRAAMVSTVPDPVPATVANTRARDAGVAQPSPAIDCEAFMNHRSPLQHLLHSLLPAKGPANSATDFVDTQPVDARAAAVQAARGSGSSPRRTAVWAESALDLELGTDIMEYSDDTSADLMHEFFAKVDKKAA
jgi:hypothetical protein